MDDAPPLTPQQRSAIQTLITDWLAARLADNPVLASVEYDADPSLNQHRWLARLLGEEKESIMLHFTLKQRMVHFETYVLAQPEENHAAFYEYFLRRNRKLVGVAFSIGHEDAVYLTGALPAAEVNEATLDRILGTFWVAVEDCFQPALRIGFASRFKK
jgi:hypothetical protein